MHSRAILSGALKPATRDDGPPTDLAEEFYKDHSKDPDTKYIAVLDPFMGGTTVVEVLRLGCRVTGFDLNPAAWFVVKTEVEPVDLDKLREASMSLPRRMCLPAMTAILGTRNECMSPNAIPLPGAEAVSAGDGDHVVKCFLRKD